MSLVAELKRRKVFKLGAAYLVVAWLAVQAASIAFPAFEAPAWALRVFIFVAVLGFPVALLAAWMIELTPEGMRLDRAPTGNKRMLAIAGALVLLGIAWFYRGALAPRPVTDGPRALAVLPFASLGQDESGMAAGLHDTLITQLSKLRGLEVRSRTSVMKYKEWNGGLKAIAKELAVNVVLEGSVQHQGKRTVVNAQLIDALTDAHLWAETFDRTGDDLFALQSEIAQKVAQALEVALSPEERKALVEAPTQNKAAYALYLQAQREINDSDEPKPTKAQEDQRKRAAELLEAAVAQDPGFALGWATLSRAYASVAWDAQFSDYHAFADKARKAAERAAALGPGLPEAHFAAGVVALQLDFDFPRGARELELAVQGAPGIASFHSRLALAYRYAGRPEDSERSSRRAHELDPTDAAYAFMLEGALVALRRWDDAKALALQMATLRPDNYDAAAQPMALEAMHSGDIAPLSAFIRANATRYSGQSWEVDRWYLEMADGDFAGALAVLDAMPEAERPLNFHALRGDTLRRMGRDAEMRAEFATLRDQRLETLESDRDPFVEANLRASLALALARLGDAEGARDNIARADRLWGIAREPSDGARVSFGLVPAQIALGDFDGACARLKEILDGRNSIPPGGAWTHTQLADLHAQPCFRNLIQRHGIDVSKEPFAFNRAAPAKAGG